MYYIYHIPGKKIGVTRDLNTRVTLVQGYKEGEYEVLEQSEDIDYISDREIELQLSYGYTKDIVPYNKLFNNMRINATEQTSTFPCPLGKLKGQLMDNIGKTWSTEFGQFEITNATIPWIVQNAKTSMFNGNRCYIYNKAYYENFLNEDHEDEGTLFDLIREWADNRGIYQAGDAKTQYIKLMEEAGELADALLKQNQEEAVDAIGDMVVVLTNLAELIDVPIEVCIEQAYNTISSRTGQMIRGTFVKDG